MKFWTKLLPVFAVLFASAPAFAGGTSVEVEPYLGYGFLGSVGDKSAYAANPSLADSYTTLGLGLRANVKFLDMFFAGPDFSYQPGLSLKSPVAEKLTYDKTNGGSLMTLGLVAGVQLPMSFRVWVGYNFLDQSSSTVSSSGAAQNLYGNISKTFNGSSFKVGAGYKVMSLLSLNAEYYFQTYSTQDVTNSGSTNYPSSGKGTKLTDTSGNILVMTVSAPLDVLNF
jgi:hypothetical protein